ADGVVRIEEVFELLAVEALRHERALGQGRSAAARELPRRVQRHREDRAEERHPALEAALELAVRPREEILVRNPPAAPEARVLEVLLLDEGAEAVAQREAAH